jgi:hypothetical protein
MCALAACGGSKKTTSTESPGGGTAPAPVVPACIDEGAGHDFAAAKALAAGSFEGCTGPEPDVYSVLAPDHAAGTLYELKVGATGGEVIATIFDQDQRELGTTTVAKGQEAALYVVLASNSRMFVRAVGTSVAVFPEGWIGERGLEAS